MIKLKYPKIVLYIYAVSLFLLFPSIVVYAQDNLKEYFEKGQQAYESGKYEEAIKYYEKVVDLDPNFAPVYNALGLAYSTNYEQLSDVIWFFNIAVELDPKFAEAYGNMCRVYYEAGKFDRAEEACLKAISIDSNLFSAKLSLGWIYLLGKQEPFKAIPFFKELLGKTQSPVIYFGLGMAYARSGNSAEALDMITNLRTMGKDDLAYQIEAALRTSSPEQPPQPAVTAADIPEKQPGTLVSSKASTSVESEKATSSPVSGQMKIRLKGQLTNFNPKKKSAPQKHPGSL